MPVPATYSIYPYPLVLEWETIQTFISTTWIPVSDIINHGDIWVKLRHLPNEYSCDEAKLLCQESSDTWIAWIPDYGEIILHRSCFY